MIFFKIKDRSHPPKKKKIIPTDYGLERKNVIKNIGDLHFFVNLYGEKRLFLDNSMDFSF